MKIQLISDVHLEFFGHQWTKFVYDMDPTDVDVLVIAGDWATKDLLTETLTAVCDLYPEVVFVAGNHEYYDARPIEIHKRLENLNNTLDNFHWLNNNVVELQDPVTDEFFRFTGTTLWFANNDDVRWQKKKLNDFHLIKDFEPWVFKQNGAAKKFLEEEAQKANVVITHHLPTQRGVAQRFVGDPFNCFFVCDVEHTLGRTKPDYWFFGHTHDKTEFEIGLTKFHCNPHGYYMHAENKEFDHKLILDLNL